MNKPKLYLWELIHSLSPAEKRYFKTHFSARPNQLTHLFDLINAQNTYDEASALTKLSVAPKQYKVLKHQLQELLMKSLVANNGKRNVKSKIRLELEEVDLLLERELYPDAIKRLRRLERLCTTYGFTLYQYEVQERLHEIQHLELDFSDPAAAAHYQRLVDLQKTLQQKQELSAIQRKLDDWNPFTPERHKVLEGIYEELMKMTAEHLDFRGSLAWLQRVAICSDLLGREEEAARYRTFILDNFAALPTLRNELPLSYLRALQHAVNPARRVPEPAYVEEIARKAQKAIAQNPQYSPHYIYFLWARLRTNYLQHEWERISKHLAVDCLQHLATYQLSELRTAVKIYTLLASTYLIKGDYARAEHYLVEYRSNKLSKDRWLDYSVNLMELILYHDSGDSERLATRLLYFRRQLRQEANQEELHLYRLNLTLFADILREPYNRSEIAVNLLLKTAEYPYDRLLYYYSFFNIERWLQSVAAKRSWRATIV